MDSTVCFGLYGNENIPKTEHISKKKKKNQFKK